MKNLHLPGIIVKGILGSASRLSSMIGPALVDKSKVERIANLSYGSYGNKLDVVKARGKAQSNLPITILIHGGGFRFFSKDGYTPTAAVSAMNGQLTFNIDYRLTPKHPYPAGLTDVIEAYSWVLENAEKYGGDLSRISLVGDSAGANYALALCLYLFEMAKMPATVNLPSLPKVKPVAAVVHCGFLQVTNPKRFNADSRCFPIARTRMIQIQENYLPESLGRDDEDFGLANPLVVLEKFAEQNTKLPEGFPEIFVPVGSNDPVIGDSERLGKALERLGQKNRLKLYEGSGHAFYAFTYSQASKKAWADIKLELEKSAARS